VEALKGTRPAFDNLVSRGAWVSDAAVKTLTASRDGALASAEKAAREQGADDAADALHAVRSATGVLGSEELPIEGFDELPISDAVAAIKELTDSADIRAIVAYEEAHKNRQRVVSAAQTRVAAIAKEVVGIS
jgi:hypothetical protein